MKKSIVLETFYNVLHLEGPVVFEGDESARVKYLIRRALDTFLPIILKDQGYSLLLSSLSAVPISGGWQKQHWERLETLGKSCPNGVVRRALGNTANAMSAHINLPNRPEHAASNIAWVVIDIPEARRAALECLELAAKL